MTLIDGPAWRAFSWLALAVLLDGCASHTLPSPEAQASPLNGRFSTGTVVSVRAITLGNDNGSVDQVLTALGQPPASAQEQTVEIVIRRPDNTITSIIQPAQIGQPDFVPGEGVAIVEAAATVVRPE